MNATRADKYLKEVMEAHTEVSHIGLRDELFVYLFGLGKSSPHESTFGIELGPRGFADTVVM